MTWRLHAEPDLLRAARAAAGELEARGFGSSPTTPRPPEAAGRLGWLDLPRRVLPSIPGWVELRQELLDDGFDRLLVVGMGGSGIASRSLIGLLPQVRPALRIAHLDSLDPEAVRVEVRAAKRTGSAILFASKSGTTAETLVLEAVLREAGSRDPRRRLLAVTDPGSPLFDRAAREGWRRVIQGYPDVGGRYSALGPFGAVPAILGGRDFRRALLPALALAEGMRRAGGPSGASDAQEAEDPGFGLGGVLVQLVRAGRTRALVSASREASAILRWVEQMLAESTGKEGRGVLPVLLSGVPRPKELSKRTFLVHFGDVGADRPRLEWAAAAARVPVILCPIPPEGAAAEIYRWQVAVAAAALALGINPFDQPDVEGAKRAARRLMAGSVRAVPRPATGACGDFAAAAASGGLVVNVFGARTRAAEEGLAKLQRDFAARFGTVPAVGFGSALLHSIGQLEKGGPPDLAVLMLTWGPGDDVEIPPGSALPPAAAGLGTGEFVRLQAAADHEELIRRGRPVLWLDTEVSGDRGLEELLARFRTETGEI